MPELRQNPINKRWVVIAKERAKRPDEFVEEHVYKAPDPSSDPFALGNEDMTPPEVFAYSPDPNRAPNTDNWTVRVVPNKFPVFEGDGGFHIQEDGIFISANAVGIHDVIITDNPEQPLAKLPVSTVRDMLHAYKTRILQVRDSEDVSYTLPIYNHGKEAGGSLPHPHSQLFGFPLVSNYIKFELEKEKEFFEKGGCGHCEIVTQEGSVKERVIMETDNVISMAPYASREPFETVIYPKHHLPRFEEMDDSLFEEIAEVLKDACNRLYNGLGNPNFNYYLHTAPHDGENYDYTHWHLKILPRTSIRAGFELGTGIIVNTMPPEQAAEFLRGVDVLS